ncbi:hypothetical protein D3C86_1666730 [compost metagenome]
MQARFRQARLDELPLLEVGERDEGVHPVLPGGAQAMHGEHGGDPGGLHARAPVAAAHDARPGEGLIEAVLTEPAFSEEEGIRACEPVVMECLHHRDCLLAAGVVDRRGK